MNNCIELQPNELQTCYQPSDFTFTTTDELTGSNGIIGQESAYDALARALKINSKGYNIYLSGDENVGKLTTVKKVLEEHCSKLPIPKDICYVYDFNHPQVPKLMMLEPGMGKQFSDHMSEFRTFIVNDLPLKLQSKSVQKQKQTIADKYEDSRGELWAQLETTAEQLGIVIKETTEGIGFAPIGKDGKLMTKEEYDRLEDTEREQIEEKLEKLYELADELATGIEEYRKVCMQQIEDIEQMVLEKEVGYSIKYLKEIYKDELQIIKYLNELWEDLVQNSVLFTQEQSESDQALRSIFPWVAGSDTDKLTKKYEVNLLVDNSKQKQAPIVIGENTTKSRLLGRILVNSEMNTLYSDLTHIRPGMFHYANGGYLVLYVQEVLENTGTWETLKKVLKSGKVTIDNIEDMGLYTVSAMRPEPMPVQMRVILLGNDKIYEALSQYDEEFKKLFKVKIDFIPEIDGSKEKVEKFACCIKEVCSKEELPPVSLDAILKILKYGHRITGNPKKLPANIATLIDLVRESSIFATNIIDTKCVESAISHRKQSIRYFERQLDERILNNIYMIDTKGERIGQINGLAVYHIGEYMFGKPIKITTTTYKGQLGIVDVEKEAGLGGEIHTKGVKIITGFLGHHFAQENPLALNCNICVEQNYSGIDGDSASSAELYAILSSLAEIPIRQDIAVTGSINQYGEIQPIGGVNEKIEGFFKLCKQRGLNGEEGVIIPKQNIEELMLEDEIIEAVKDGLFHIYPITHVEQGMQILTNVPYEHIYERVNRKLQRYSMQKKDTL